MKNNYVLLSEELKKKTPLAVATIIETKGSVPQIPGASAVFDSEKLILGTVGGGLLEATTQKKVFQSLNQKSSQLFDFSLSADINSEEGAICGGEVKILIDANPEDHNDTFHNLSQSLSHHKAGVLVTIIGEHDEKATVISRYWVEEKETFFSNIPEKSNNLFNEEINIALRENKTRLLKINDNIFEKGVLENIVFFEPIFPLPRLVIAGAGHIGQVVCHLGNLLSFEVTVIDDRSEFANHDKLPDADHIIVEDIGKAMQDCASTPNQYFVIVTRAHKHDAEALHQCIHSEAAYIGVIGSSRKITLMRKKFIEEGWATPQELDRIYAPIGVDIQSNTVEEIGISIAAQLVLVRSQILGKKRD